MHKRQLCIANPRLQIFIHLTAALFMMLVAPRAFASSCINCHLDEDMLEENLSPTQQQASALTSGAG